MSNYIYGVFYEDGTIVVLSPHDEEKAEKLARYFAHSGDVIVKRRKVGEWEDLDAQLD